LVEREIPVEVEIDLAVEYHDDEIGGMNVIAEIQGGKRKGEVVMLGAHLDSWHAGTGATDNGGSCAVVMEAMRILKALDLKMARTVRCALWSGEEQGLYGSRGYVRQHFGNPLSMELEPEHAKLSAYYNLDYGHGKIRGIYLQGNDMARPIFEAWLRPFHDMGAQSIGIRSAGGTDHLSFNDVGLPAFQFMQDPVDYGMTWHSNMDGYDHLKPGDLMQAAAVLASVIYHTANREEMIPRKPLPEPLPEVEEMVGK